MRSASSVAISSDSTNPASRANQSTTNSCLADGSPASRDAANSSPSSPITDPHSASSWVCRVSCGIYASASDLTETTMSTAYGDFHTGPRVADSFSATRAALGVLPPSPPSPNLTRAAGPLWVLRRLPFVPIHCDSASDAHAELSNQPSWTSTSSPASAISTPMKPCSPPTFTRHLGRTSLLTMPAKR